jgi:hypothetical protein
MRIMKASSRFGGRSPAARERQARALDRMLFERAKAWKRLAAARRFKSA